MTKRATGKIDVFGPTTKDTNPPKPKKSKTAEPQSATTRKPGRPKIHTDDIIKTVLTIKRSQMVWLDQLALHVRAAGGSVLDRGGLIRSTISLIMDTEYDFSEVQTIEDYEEVLQSKKLKRK